MFDLSHKTDIITKFSLQMCTYTQQKFRLGRMGSQTSDLGEAFLLPAPPPLRNARANTDGDLTTDMPARDWMLVTAAAWHGVGLLITVNVCEQTNVTKGSALML